jgi:hypothetical protein
VVGGLVLAAVTSLPNVVAAVYLAARGRGAATLSTALNSNNLNVVAGLLLPAVVIGLGRPSDQAVLIAVWYAILTGVVLCAAFLDRGLGRAAGVAIIAAYAVFAGSVVWVSYAASPSRWLLALPLAITILAVCARMAVSSRAARRAPSVLVGWPVGRVWGLGLALSMAVAATDAALGSRVVLIGLLIVGPCCVFLTGRWVPTGLTGLWVVGLAVILGVPDGIWGTATHAAFLTAVAIVAAACTASAALIGRRSNNGVL